MADGSDTHRSLRLDRLHEDHRILSGHRCSCGWEGDSATTHIIDIVVAYLRNAPALDRERLRVALERLLKDSEVPAYFGPGSAWNQALNALDGRDGDD